MVRVTLSGEALTRGHPLVRATLLDDEGPQPLPRVEEGSEALPPHRVSNKMRSELHPPPLPLLAALRRAKTPRTGSSKGTISACRLQGWE